MLGVDYEHWKICEWSIPSIIAYASVHRNELEWYGQNFCGDLSKEQIAKLLFDAGVSADYNKPATLEQLKRMSEDKLRLCFNSIQWANNLVDVSRVKGRELNIVDTETFTYLLTYSFPCQDLSTAGKCAGMEKGSGTRSGLLWEVERILTECNEWGKEHLPQLLLMENVCQVHGAGNEKHFKQWMLRLEELGYQNYWQDLSATEFKIPQTRNRTFMVSILNGKNGEKYNYTFPKKTKLELRLKDLLEPEGTVDEKYYISDKMLNYISKTGGGGENVGVVVKENTPKEDDILKKELCNKLIKDGLVDEYDVVKHSYTNQIFDGNKKCVEKSDGVMITLTTRGDCVGVVVKEKDIDKVEVLGNYSPSNHESSRIVSSSSYPTVKENHGTVPAIDESELLGGIGEKDSNGGTQWKYQNRVYSSSSSSPSVTTAFNPNYKCGLRIRKLTPKECFRLQGVTDENIALIMENQSNSLGYHLAGDSICITVLMGIISAFYDGVNWLDHFNPKEWWKNENNKNNRK